MKIKIPFLLGGSLGESYFWILYNEQLTRMLIKNFLKTSSSLRINQDETRNTVHERSRNGLISSPEFLDVQSVNHGQ